MESVDLERGNYYAIPPVAEESIDLETSENVETSATWAETVEKRQFSRYEMIGQFVGALLPSFLTGNWKSQTTPLGGRQQDTAYLDGMRGCAALAVFIGHYALPYQPGMIYSYGLEEHRGFLQLPIFRLLYSGSSMVAIFFVVSGFALSLKPMSYILRRQWEQLAHSMMSSIFRRGIRLFLPTLIASFAMMVAAHLHFYDIPYEGGVEGFQIPEEYDVSRPKYLPTFLIQVQDWICFVLTKLFRPASWFEISKASPGIYGGQLWTIPIEFWGSMLLFLAILGLAKLRSTVRLVILLLLSTYSLWAGRWEPALFLAGLCIAELDSYKFELPSTTLTRLREGAWYLILLCGLFFASYPDIYDVSAYGFEWMKWLSADCRVWQSLGAIQIFWAVTNVACLRDVFAAAPFRYLGRISYSFYIVHVPINETFGWILVPLMWKITGTDTELQKQVGFGLGILLCALVVFWVADVFCRIVDEPCTRFAKRLEAKLCKYGCI